MLTLCLVVVVYGLLFMDIEEGTVFGTVCQHSYLFYQFELTCCTRSETTMQKQPTTCSAQLDELLLSNLVLPLNKISLRHDLSREACNTT